MNKMKYVLHLMLIMYVEFHRNAAKTVEVFAPQKQFNQPYGNSYIPTSNFVG